MKNFTLILILLFNYLFIQPSFSQCKMLYDGKDEFTGKIIKETKLESGYLSAEISRAQCNDCGFKGTIGFAKYDSILIFKVLIEDADYYWSLKENALGMLKLESGDIIEMFAEHHVFASSKVNGETGANIWWEGIIRFIIPKKYWEKLQNSNPEKLRIYFNEDYNNGVFTRTGKFIFHKYLKCVME